MKKNQFLQYLAISTALTLLLPTIANAHTGIGDTNGFIHGLEHPISGLDHILAMVAVGLWAVQIGGKALWLVPGTFVLAMAAGSVVGHFQIPFPGIEQGILASDFLLGILILMAARLPLALSTSIVGLLAIFHGYAHGAEIPETASGLTYGVGFIVSTALLHLTGLGIGLGFDRLPVLLRKRSFRAGGAAIVIGAVYVFVNH